METQAALPGPGLEAWPEDEAFLAGACCGAADSEWSSGAADSLPPSLASMHLPTLALL